MPYNLIELKYKVPLGNRDTVSAQIRLIQPFQAVSQFPWGKGSNTDVLRIGYEPR